MSSQECFYLIEIYCDFLSELRNNVIKGREYGQSAFHALQVIRYGRTKVPAITKVTCIATDEVNLLIRVLFKIRNYREPYSSIAGPTLLLGVHLGGLFAIGFSG